MTTKNSESSILKYFEKGSPKILIKLFNDDFEQIGKQYNSFCRLINDRLSIQNNLQFSPKTIDPGFNRQTRIQLMANINQLNSSFNSLAGLLNQSPFKKLDKGLIILYDFHAYLDIGIKLNKEEINDYIKQVEGILKELFDFKVKYRFND